jgi:hypothetical protein
MNILTNTELRFTKFFSINMCAIVGIFLAGAASTSIDLIAPEYVGLVDLKTGTRLALVLLFGYWVFPGILLGSIGANMLFLPYDDIHNNIRVIFAMIESTLPYLALLFLHQFKWDQFYADSRMITAHLIALCALTSIMCSLAMVLVMQSLRLTENYRLFEHLGAHFSGTFSGTFIVFFMFIIMTRAFMAKLKE